VIALRKYQDAAGHTPYDDWLSGLRDIRARKRIQIRVERLGLGLEGDWKPVGEGVRELRVPEGKGYRVYYAWDGSSVVLLLCGGDKSSQTQDIARALQYWRDYRGH
jgi:putative addiction module killer protein